MAKIKVKILQNGQPLQNAEVIIGDKWEGSTNSQGQFEGNIPPGLADKMLCPIYIKTDTLEYGSTVRLEKDKETVIEV